MSKSFSSRTSHPRELERMVLSSFDCLETLLSEPIGGTWTLRVTDKARIDEGTLNEWSLRIRPAVEEAVHASETPGTDIPDNDPNGITSDIAVTGVPTCDLLVSVDLQIDHTYRGDLLVMLSGPGGASTTLHNRTGASQDNVQLQNVAVDGSLLEDGGPNGTWTLHVSDHAGYDLGTLVEWTLRFTCD